MAITLLPSAVEVEIPSRPHLGRLKGLPSIFELPGEKIGGNIFALVMGAFVFLGLLSLLAVNILMTQDAFVLQRLKHQTNIINDQRDAVLRMEERMSSPSYLAGAAKKLGMKPADHLTYLNLPTSGSVK